MGAPRVTFLAALIHTHIKTFGVNVPATELNCGHGKISGEGAVAKDTAFVLGGYSF